MNAGKEMCEVLKSMRKKIAEQYGLVYEPTECHHEGNCQGTCPRCDAELRDLQRQLEEKGVPHGWLSMIHLIMAVLCIML